MRPASRAKGQLTKPQGALGRLEELSAWLAFWQGGAPKLEKPLVCVFAANHGVAARGVSAYPAAVTAQMVANFRDGGAGHQSIGAGDRCRASRVRAFAR